MNEDQPRTPGAPAAALVKGNRMTIDDSAVLGDLLQALHGYFMTGERMPPWRETPPSFRPELVQQASWCMGHARASADHLAMTEGNNARAIAAQETRAARAAAFADTVNRESTERNRAHDR